ncbi:MULTISPECIES: type I restriction enzyme HsdR N-terminal domain-containing protein [Pseudanabaena]|uniref:Restriction endonuclease, type I, EcoRI, R subunit/Type III n=2 Tax=Pseudanabaena TaxID=1152 RepID=L8MYW2_9CYAN|nr:MULTISPECIES: type I restriction enzyme HsdR N-terminal domain-containing protein [Pseudanabaena]ELS31650.1 Restriction endonuclease, type I, EcoRI, R subunit/Type III [Pseudanabaena biceps PCC 7429]MDG3496085.1 type I restriction enzyme HsdR N-terminal domain-containing protein [Pseudanabaena catenata USMAC16]
MTQAIAAKDVTLRELKQNFGIQISQDSAFFTEWLDSFTTLSEEDKRLLDRVKANFLELMEDPPMLENTVKMVVLAPLLDLAGFYHKPFRIETETAIALEMKDEEAIIRGRIDVLVIKNQLWLLVIESKRSDFAVTRAIPQALAYMLSNSETVQPTFGMITNGNEFLFLKTSQNEYANSRLFSLVNPNNELYEVLQILKHLGSKICM